MMDTEIIRNNWKLFLGIAIAVLALILDFIYTGGAGIGGIAGLVN